MPTPRWTCRAMCRFPLAVLVFLLATPALARTDAVYDPLTVAEREVQTLDLDAVDSGRERTVPVRVYLPTDTAAAPVILFSHGLGGSREGSTYLGRHWSARGYVGVFLQHPGSDAAVWQSVPPAERREALRQAASARAFFQRAGDVPAVLDQLAVWHQEGGHPLQGRLDLDRIGMAGHSFGAITTQAASGQATGRPDLSFTDGRIRAAVIMSPSVPRRGATAEQAFGAVTLPWLLMTGTEDGSPFGDLDPASRLGVYDALPAGDKYQLVFEGGGHFAFSERTISARQGTRNPNHHRAILALSTAFWDTYLRDDASARVWLDGEGAKSVLGKGDGWDRK